MATRPRKKVAAGRSPKRSSKPRARTGLHHDGTDPRILDHLSDEDGRQVLLALVARHPELLSEVAELVEGLLGQVAFEQVADDILEGVANLEIFDMNRFSGRQPFGYVGPAEAAAEMVQEVIGPYVDRIGRCAAIGLHEAALELCRGVLLGLYRGERCDQTDVVAWIPDGLSEFADGPIAALAGDRARRDRDGRIRVPKDIARFAKEQLPDWDWLHR
jgi:hypothetical protein